jgi:hypothetical protein
VINKQFCEFSPNHTCSAGYRNFHSLSHSLSSSFTAAAALVVGGTFNSLFADDLGQFTYGRAFKQCGDWNVQTEFFLQPGNNPQPDEGISTQVEEVNNSL